jgi:hypothetical protein
MKAIRINAQCSDFNYLWGIPFDYGKPKLIGILQVFIIDDVFLPLKSLL